MLAGPRACPRDCNKKEGVEEQFPEVVGNSHYEKLWNHFDKRELQDFGSTKLFLITRYC